MFRYLSEFSSILSVEFPLSYVDDLHEYIWIHSLLTPRRVFLYAQITENKTLQEIISLVQVLQINIFFKYRI